MALKEQFCEKNNWDFSTTNGAHMHLYANKTAPLVKLEYSAVTTAWKLLFFFSLSVDNFAVFMLQLKESEN